MASIPITDKDGNVIAWAHAEDPEGPPKEDPRLLIIPEPRRPYPGTPMELVSFGETFFNECLRIAEARNLRYAGAYDPFKNFRLGGQYGIAIRMSDKVSRLLTLTEPHTTIDGGDESIEDTCRDLANYAMLLIALRRNESGDPTKTRPPA